MIWKRYQNEVIVFIALLLMLSGYLYKNTQITSQSESMAKASRSIGEIKEVIALQKIWSDQRITQKVNKLQGLISEDKVTWNSQNKKVTATYQGLTVSELNTLVTKILNVPVEIQKLNIQKMASTYNVEFKCKW